MERTRGPRFLRFCIPIIDVLNELGGSGKAAEITDVVIERLQISEEEQAELLKNGNSRVRNQIAWARFYLPKADLSFEHVIDGTGQFVSQDGQGLALAVLFLQFGQEFLSFGVIPQE